MRRCNAVGRSGKKETECINANLSQDEAKFMAVPFVKTVSGGVLRSTARPFSEQSQSLSW